MNNVKLMAVTAKLETRNNVAKNMHRHEIRKGDLVVVLDGFYKGNIVIKNNTPLINFRLPGYRPSCLPRFPFPP